MFDRLLVLHEGKPAYLGELGQHSRTLIDYFQRHGSRECGVDENPATSIQGVQNQIFSTFLLLTLHGNLVQITLSHFMDSRTLYEARERSSRTYSWIVFVLSNMIAELPGIFFLAAIQFVTWYYPIKICRYTLTTRSLSSRGTLMSLIHVSFFLFSSPFSQMLGTMMPDPATGVNISALLYTSSLIFCRQNPQTRILAPITSLPKFRTFVYRSTPVTYLASSLLSTGISGVNITCASHELLHIVPPPLSPAPHISHPIYRPPPPIYSPQEVSQPAIFVRVGVFYAHRGRDLAISWVYSGVNVGGALGLYWMARVPRKVGVERKMERKMQRKR
ncbi:putative abc protein [Botrytis fragariae]|uniref:Putative abc protein n=1 Tax=Botrytis fragariae TaxID=1964551 RepID=A0A8H6EF78_9HELO|nr:putative abc protein [Botrytis fragariae]KAF5869943.1 putative abc protein [Botrytis fragariae]